MERKQYTISFSDNEAHKIKAIAKASGESMSGYIRRQVMFIVKEEESQNV